MIRSDNQQKWLKPMTKLTKLTSLILLTLILSGPANAIDFSVPKSVYQLPPQVPNSQARLSETAYRQLQPIQKKISAEQYDEAFIALNQLVKRHNENPYVVSVAMKSAAYIYIAQQDYTKAIKWMQQVLKLSAMSPQELQTIRHDLSQLQLQAGQYQNAVNTMQHWLKEAKPSQISAADYQLLAVSQFQLKHYKKARQAAQKSLKKSKPLVEPLYQLILACDLALKNYASANKTLATLIKLNPSHKNYWVQWAGVLDLQEKPNKALGIFELMDKRQMLNNEHERIQFVQRLIQQGNSFKAANRLSKYIKKDEVSNSTENKLLLALAWEHSGENDKSIHVLKGIISAHKNNEATTHLAQIYVAGQQWQALVNLLEQQLDAQVTTENAPLYLQWGYAYYQLTLLNKAEQVFRALENSKQSSKTTQQSAKQWLKYLEGTKTQ